MTLAGATIVSFSPSSTSLSRSYHVHSEPLRGNQSDPRATVPVVDFQCLSFHMERTALDLICLLFSNALVNCAEKTRISWILLASDIRGLSRFKVYSFSSRHLWIGRGHMTHESVIDSLQRTCSAGKRSRVHQRTLPCGWCFAHVFRSRSVLLVACC